MARLRAAARYKKELAELRERTRTLYAAIAHGEYEHREWLRKAINAHFGVASEMPKRLHDDGPHGGPAEDPMEDFV